MNTTLVKICGLTNLEDARVAVAAGADLLGFIFYAKSPRYVTPEAAAAIVRALREDRERMSQGEKSKQQVVPSPKVVGVFVNASVAEIEAMIATVGLDYVQLHGNETTEWFSALGQRAFKAVRPADGAAAQAEAEQFAPLGCAAGPWTCRGSSALGGPPSWRGRS